MSKIFKPLPDVVFCYADNVSNRIYCSREPLKLGAKPVVTFVKEDMLMEKIARIAELEQQLEMSEQFLNNETNKVTAMDQEIQSLRSVIQSSHGWTHSDQWFVAEKLREQRESWTITVNTTKISQQTEQLHDNNT